MTKEAVIASAAWQSPPNQSWSEDHSYALGQQLLWERSSDREMHGFLRY